MLDWMNRYRRNRMVDHYITLLGPALRSRYGLREQYTVPQIQKTLVAIHLNTQYLAYAVALYRHEASRNTVNLRLSQTFLDSLRAEMAKRYFHGRDSYRAHDVLGLVKTSRWRGGRPADGARPWAVGAAD
ncbi:DUF6559 family protein [Marinobacter bohaiensis]|uniref:DUF6559 family protein n=1 Tax=Marinobacter bohaiensis TaxID=2201898 RepID=UPI000DAF2DC8|nr:DUF6559 family protein [Marinobacter bohaiensis]